MSVASVPYIALAQRATSDSGRSSTDAYRVQARVTAGVAIVRARVLAAAPVHRLRRRAGETTAHSRYISLRGAHPAGSGGNLLELFQPASPQALAVLSPLSPGHRASRSLRRGSDLQRIPCSSPETSTHRLSSADPLSTRSPDLLPAPLGGGKADQHSRCRRGWRCRSVPWQRPRARRLTRSARHFEMRLGVRTNPLHRASGRFIARRLSAISRSRFVAQVRLRAAPLGLDLRSRRAISNGTRPLPAPSGSTSTTVCAWPIHYSSTQSFDVLLYTYIGVRDQRECPRTTPCAVRRLPRSRTVAIPLGSTCTSAISRLTCTDTSTARCLPVQRSMSSPIVSHARLRATSGARQRQPRFQRSGPETAASLRDRRRPLVPRRAGASAFNVHFRRRSASDQGELPGVDDAVDARPPLSPTRRRDTAG